MKTTVALVSVWIVGASTLFALEESDAACKNRRDEISRFYKSLPKTFAPGKSADELARKSQEAVQQCHEFLKECATGAGPEETGQIEFIYAKALYILSQRFRHSVYDELRRTGVTDLRAELDRRMSDYFTQVQTLARRALERLPENHEYRARGLELLGLSLHEGGKHREADNAYREFLTKYGDDSEAHRIAQAAARNHLDGEDYETGTEVLEEALKEYYESESYPFYVETLRKLNVGKGDIAGFERAVRIGQITLPLKGSSPGATTRVKQTCERLMHYYGFWYGYGRMAAGDFSTARQAFTDHIAKLDAWEKELATQGQQLKPEYSVYRGRSQATLDFLNELAERQAPRELDLQWVTTQRVQLSESLGKVTGILFRNAGERRSQEFMARMSLVCAGRDDLQMVAAHFLRQGQDRQQREQLLVQEINDIGYLGAAGFDPDAEDQKLFGDFKVTVGSASFVIIDRSGSLVWFMEDPTLIDVNFAKSVMLRAADES